MIHPAIKPDIASCENEWAVILAGGDGTRLKSLTRQIAGDERPKQFCQILGVETLIEQTRRRVALEFARQRTLFVLNRSHEAFYGPLLSAESAANLLAQPCNRGTAPAILYSLGKIARRNPGAIAAFFPSDHYVSDDKQFMAQMRSALDFASQRRDLVILLGIEPEHPEVEYGWIEPAAPISTKGAIPVFAVRRFWEKPHQELAKLLQRRGCLWNSFVMVSAVQTLLEMIDRALPELSRGFAALREHVDTGREAKAVRLLYESLGEINFSREVLAVRPEQLAVAPVTGVRWNDLGEPRRVMVSLRMGGFRPDWAEPNFPPASDLRGHDVLNDLSLIT